MALALRPSLAEVRALAADHDLVPVVTELVADCATPVSAMLALGTGPSCFLLESVEGGERVGRYSFLGRDPLRTLRVDGAPSPPAGSPPAGGPSEDPLSRAEREVLGTSVAPVEGLDIPFAGGAVGFLSYEAARFYERIPAPACDPLALPAAWFGIFTTVVVFDHVARTMLLVTHVRGRTSDVAAEYRRAAAVLEELCERLGAPPPAPLRRPARAAVDMRALESRANISRERFLEIVERCREYILAGDIFQVQLSRRFTVPLTVPPFEVYRSLRSINPSPYMFFLATPACSLVGTSPEMLVRVTGSRIEYHPIAGTRRRGRTPEHDGAMEEELRGSEKERAEHLMLVDLGRNDVGRVARTGSVRVPQLMDVERYSHVMHLVSSIEGTLREDLTSVDALRACFPAGTVTGAPKVRAMEIIAELEPEARGPYSGAVGYIGFGGNLDTAIALRTIVAGDGVAHAQAAAGIVADSTPREEALEIDNKVAPLLCALEEGGR